MNVFQTCNRGPCSFLPRLQTNIGELLKELCELHNLRPCSRSWPLEGPESVHTSSRGESTMPGRLGEVQKNWVSASSEAYHGLGLVAVAEEFGFADAKILVSGV